VGQSGRRKLLSAQFFIDHPARAVHDCPWLFAGGDLMLFLPTILTFTLYQSEKPAMNPRNIITIAVLLSICSGPAFAAKEKEKNKNRQLPQGLQMKLERGGSLPPGWQKKLVKGEILEQPIFNYSKTVIPVDPEGLLTVRVEGKLIKLIEATREIVEIVDLLN
jgi:hypothetical protein